MKLPALLTLLLGLSAALQAADPRPAAPTYPRPLRELNSSYFPFNADGPAIPEGFAQRKEAVRNRILLAAGLFPLPTKTPLNAVIHGRIERDDYTIDRVFFESFPGHFVCGNLYLPKNAPKDSKMPGILCPHGHWPTGRIMDLKAGSAAVKEQIAIGAERWECGARSPLQARCVQLARMGCAVFFYDMLGNADSIQIAEHRSGRRKELDGAEPGSFGLYSAMADLRLESNFGLQTWNSIRALDFILTVPGVDPARISCTGASGGGTQTLMLAAVDDRLAAAFPCVMTSTAMQGGCTCENACYLRIHQGNIDIAANFAPKPMGMTAADDWTKELATKGFPDLKMVWTKLGKPDNIMATFNIHWKHNYNHVSRTTMYGFMNQHFKLGFSAPVLEREFVVSTPEELTVWTKDHPKPEGDKAGGAHEKALLKHWSEDSDAQLKAKPELLAKAWDIIVGRPMPAGNDVTFDAGKEDKRGSCVITHGITRYTKDSEEVPVTFFSPPANQWKGTTALWLTSQSIQEPDAAMKKLLRAGVAIAIPQLYLPGATQNPWNPVKTKDQTNHDSWQWSACYTYGYNHPLVVHRVHDAMSTLAMLKQREQKLKRIILAASDGMGAVGALAAATLKDVINGAVIDTEGFRFATLRDAMHPEFVPGAVKYGDVPALLSLCDPARLTVLGEKEIKGGPEAVAVAVLKLAK
ncbi:MAG: acetylxylan esterase [Verrucomicrobia bacterium]|nr:acetylxylan esterase [Verrucomicrobiota bacterium]